MGDAERREPERGERERRKGRQRDYGGCREEGAREKRERGDKGDRQRRGGQTEQEREETFFHDAERREPERRETTGTDREEGDRQSERERKDLLP